MDKSIHATQYRTMIKLLREMREERKITQEQLAERLHVKQAFISKVETCERRLDMIELRQICQSLGIAMTDFIQHFEDRIRL